MKALITGITGQVGSYLAELLLKKDYKVHGLIRMSSSFNTGRIEHLYEDPHDNPKLILHYGDLADSGRLTDLLYVIKPDLIFNMGAMSHVRVSFDIPEYTGNITGLAVIRLLEAIRKLKLKTRFYNAASSELFGNSPAPQNENTVFDPRSPYAVAKMYGYYVTKNYREAYNMFACNGILFNTESPRRGETFVTKKIVKAAVRIKQGLQNKLYLGNIEAKRDWSYVKDSCEAIWRIINHDIADDFVIGTGETHSVKEFLEEVFNFLDLDWKDYVVIDSRYFRPTEVNVLQADADKARKILGWKPIITFKELVKIMIDNEIGT